MEADVPRPPDVLEIDAVGAPEDAGGVGVGVAVGVGTFGAVGGSIVVSVLVGGCGVTGTGGAAAEVRRSTAPVPGASVTADRSTPSMSR
jgi:hypothetical protein